MRVLVLCAALVLFPALVFAGPPGTFHCGKQWITFHGRELLGMEMKDGKWKRHFHDPMPHTFRKGDILHLSDGGRSVFTKTVISDGQYVQIGKNDPSLRRWRQFHVSPVSAAHIIKCLD